MRDHHLIKESVIKREDIDKNNYTLSLFNQSLAMGIISKEIIRKFQLDSLGILKKLIMKYTFGESSSVKVETAENIMLSIYYCIDAYMASLNMPEKSMAMLEEIGLQEIYNKGVKEVRSCMEECKILYEDVKKNKLDIKLQAYNETVEKALADFFRCYNCLFNAHDTMCSIDYPLSLDDMSIQGVFYIKQYLERLILETKFCHCFHVENIENLL